MESVLIVAASDKSAHDYTRMVGLASIDQITTLQNCGDARRLLLEREFDIVVIHAPLPDESGESLAKQIVSSGITQVIYLVAGEYFDTISASCESEGVLTLAKPVDSAVFWMALKLAIATQNRLRRTQDENNRLKKKIDDIRIVDRAKYLLISHLNMNEQEAHRYIEKQAMDLRLARRTVAEGILKTYGD